MFDPESYPDPDDPECERELREQGLDDEQVGQALAQLRYLRQLTPEQRAEQEQQSQDISMGLALPLRKLETAELLEIVEVARERDYNRQLSEEEVGRIDPEGIHLLRPLMLHRHAQAEPVPAHMRCQAHLKLADRAIERGAYERTLDVPMELFVELEEVDGGAGEGLAEFADRVWRAILDGS